MKVATLFSDGAAERCAVAMLAGGGMEVLPQRDLSGLLASVRRGVVDAAVLQDDEQRLAHWMSALAAQAAPPCPAIIVGPGDPEGIQRALRCGAADYVTVTEDRSRMLARLFARARRRAEPAPVLRAGEYVLTAADQRVAHGAHQVALTRFEFGMAWLLFRDLGRVVSTRTLCSEVWGKPEELSKRTIEQHAYRLRRKLGAGLHRPPGELRIRAVYGVGYRLEIR
jgi:DNA-binding response OmpR family regulator